MRRNVATLRHQLRHFRNVGVVGTAIGTMALAAVLSGCSSSASTTSTTVASTPTTTAKSTTSKVVAAPIGYMVDTQADSTHGPVTPAKFDQWIGAGSASTYHFTDGYDVTYGNTATSETIEVTLYTFASPADATAFLNALVQQAPATSLSPTTTSIASIPGSTVLTSTKAGSDSFYLTDVIAQKNDTVLFVEYANDSPPNGMAPAFTSVVDAQYAKL
jgi:hypothetical protein